jgi:periodic tryptophan protein 1
MVVNFDARTLPSDLNQPSPARFTIAAHDGAACALDVNPHIRGCLATAGTDKMVKIWNVQGDDETGGKRQVSLVAGRDLGLVSPFKCCTILMQTSVLIGLRARCSRLSGRQMTR